MIIYTDGEIDIRLDSDVINYSVTDDITIRGAIGLDNIATLKVTSNTGYLYYEEINGVHTFFVGSEPLEAIVPEVQ